MDEELKNLIQGAKSQGASDNDIKRIIDLYIADSKKKGVTQPISQKKQLESPAQQVPTPTSLDTEETQPPAVSDGLGGPPKSFPKRDSNIKSIMYGDGMEQPNVLVQSLPLGEKPKKFYRLISDQKKEVDKKIIELEDRNVRLGRRPEDLAREGTYQSLVNTKRQLDEQFKPAERALQQVKKETSTWTRPIEVLTSAFTDGKYTLANTETIKLNKDVEDKIIDSFDNAPEETRQKWYKGSLPTEEKEKIINTAKVDVLNNTFKSLKQEVGDYIKNVKDNPNISQEEKNRVRTNLVNRSNAFNAQVALNFSGNLLKNNFKATDEDKNLDEAIFSKYEGYILETADAISRGIEGVISIGGKALTGIPTLALLAAEKFNQFTGASKSEDYTPIEATIDLINDTTNYNFLPSSKSEKGAIVGEDGEYNWSYRSITRTLADTLPFTLKIMSDVKKGRVEGSPQSMVSQLLNPSKNKAFADRLNVVETAYKVTINDNYKDAKEIGMDDSKAFTYANVLSLAEGVSETIMPDFKYFDSLTGSTLKNVFKSNLKEAATKQAVKNVTKDFFKNAALELGEEEFVLAVEDGLKYSLLLNHKNSEFFNIKRQKELVAATVIMSGAMGSVAVPGKFKQNRTDIYREVYNNISDIQDTFINEINSPLNDDKAKESLVTAYKFANDISNAIANAPETVTADQIDLLVQKKKLEEKKKNIDTAFHPDINEEIAGIDAKIRELSKQPAITEEVVAEEVIVPTQEVVSIDEIEKRRIDTESKINRKDLFMGVGDFSTQLGGSDTSAVPFSYKENNGIELVEYAHPKTGSVDVIVTGKSENDFVGFYRIYENGKPTNKWSSKFNNESRNKEDFKTMISGVQSLLPEGHEYTEKSSISTDGLRVWNQQLGKGYELQYDENGKVKTNSVAINGDAIVNELGIDVNKGDFENIKVVNNKDFNTVKKALLPYLEKFGLNESNIRNINGTVKIDLPVLKQSKKTEVTPAEEVVTEEVTPAEEIVSNEVANIEAKRQKELKKYDERDNKSLEQITPKNPNHEILQVGQKWDFGYNAKVQNFTDERITDEEGVQVVTKVIEAGEYDSDGKMTKMPVVEVTIFDNKEQADKYIEDKYNKIKKIIEEQKPQKKVNAKYDAELEAIEEVTPTEAKPPTEVISPEPIATEPVTEKAVTKPKTIKYNNAEYFKNEVGNWVNVKTGNEVKGIGIKGTGKKLIEELNQIERNPDRKYRLTDKGQLFNVKLNKGILEVTSDKGEKVSKTTERAVLRKHIDNFDFTRGEKAIDREDISGRPEDFDSEVANKSSNPSEIAQTIIYSEEFKDNSPRDIEVETDLKEQRIADVIGKVTKESFIEYGDINLIKGNEKQYRGWFSKNGLTVDELITDYIGDDSGVSHQDVIDFMSKYKSKADFYRKFKENVSNEDVKKLNDLIDLRTKFTKLTGLNPTSEFLRKAIEQQNRKSELNSILDQLTDEELQQRYEEQSEIISPTEGVIKIEDNKARRSEEPVVEGNKEQAFRDKVKDIPESGKVSKYLSGETIERVEGEAPRNIQDIDIMPLVEAGIHGRETVAMAKEVYGDKYIEKTLEFLDTANLKAHEKALLYVSLENEMFDLVNSEPKNVGFKKLQDLVRAKSQQFLRESSLAINMGRLRAIMKDGFNYESITDSFLSKDQLAGKKEVEKAIQSDSNAIQSEYESIVNESDIEQLILSGVEKQINEIYKKLPTARRVKADKAIAALERIQKRLKGKAYDATIGLPIALIDSGITIIKASIRTGVNIADSIEIGINYIKEKYGNDWANEGMFRDDMIEEFKSEGISEKEINVKDLSDKDIVNQALIEAGFGKEITVKKEKRNVLDWKKLAGEEGNIDKLRNNVEKIIGKEAAKELKEEYDNLRASIIEKSLKELERRNIPRKKVNLKTSAKKLAEIYNYGAFEEDSDTYDQVMNTVLGMNQLDQESFNEAKKLARSLSELFSKKDKDGNPISQESLKQGERVINKKIERLLSKVAWSESNGLYKAVTIAKEYIGAAQRSALVSIGQAIENTMSGYVSRIYNKIGFSIDNVDTKSLKESRNKLARMTFKDITLGGGLEFGDVTSPFITKSKTMDLIQNASDSRLYHALTSTALGKPFLEAADSMHKSALTAKFFQYNLIKILRKKGYSKLEAKNYVSEQLTGQSFEDALVDSKKIIDEINQNAGKKVIPDTEESIYRFANDLVNESLIQGQKVNIEEIRAALKAAETVAGFELGHEPNNIVSKPLNLFNSWIQTRIDRSVKDKKWNDAAALTTASILSGNILNPFIGGGMNWTFLGMQKVGIPTPATMYWNIKARSNKLDISSDEGMKNLEQTLKYQLLAKNANTRVVIGATISLAAFALASATGADDDLYKWLKKNAWANKYFAKVSPPVVQYMVAEKNKKISEFFGKQLNLKVDAFDEGKKIKQAIDNIASGKTQKALGGVGQLAGSRLSTPVIPWRLVRDVSDIYRGLNGLPAIKNEYKSSGFASGYFQGGMVEQLGLRPENTNEISDEELRIKNPRAYKIRMRIRNKRNK